MRDLNAAIKLNRDLAAAIVARGKIAELQGDYDQAMREYALALERGFDFPPESRQQILDWSEKEKNENEKAK